MKSAWEFINELLDKWSNDGGTSHGAALAYYAIFSLAPLLMLVVAIAGLVLGQTQAHDEVIGRLTRVLGPEGAQTVQSIVDQISAPAAGIAATVISLVTALFGASGVLAQLQASLNQIWKAAPRPGGNVREYIRRRMLSFALILGIGALLMLSLMLSTVLSGASEFLSRYLPEFSRVLPLLSGTLSFVIATALFAMIFKVLPDTPLDWRDVWLGAIATSLLFTVGKSLLGLYLGRIVTTSVYGAAGSLVMVLLWIYWSAQMLILGAEFTEVYARRYGSRREDAPSLEPSASAEG